MKQLLATIRERLAAFWFTITARGPIGWFLRLFNIVKTYHANLQIIGAHMDELAKIVAETERYVKKATKVHVDISARADAPSTVIVVGTYRGKDYVRVFPLFQNSVDDLVRHLEGMSQYADIGRLDMPPQIDASVRRELKDKRIITL